MVEHPKPAVGDTWQGRVWVREVPEVLPELPRENSATRTVLSPFSPSPSHFTRTDRTEPF